MKVVDLQKIPNFTFSVSFEGNIYILTFRYIDPFMVYSISIDGETVIESNRCICNAWLIPFNHKRIKGNFKIESADKEQYPIYGLFNQSFKLVYYSKEEIEGADYGI